MLSLVGASRGRPNASHTSIESALSTARGEPNILIRLDEDDPLLPQYLSKFSHLYVVGPRLGKGTARPTNEMARWAFQTQSEICMHFSDDQEFITQDWNWKIVEVASLHRNRPTAFRVNEGRTKLEHPIINRAWYDTVGSMYPPEFQHLYCDTFIEAIGVKAGRLITIPDVTILHHKGQLKDSTSGEAREHAQQDFRAFIAYGELIDGLAKQIAG